MITTEEMNNQFHSAFAYWKNTTGFEPVSLLASVDHGECYEVNSLHVFKLKRGYAIVHESGCSCYEFDSASIDILPSLKAVKESLQNASRDQYSYGKLAKETLAELLGKS